MCFKIVSKILANQFSIVLTKLIGREQSGLLVGCCPFDNINASQEAVYSIERETNDPSRMIIKIDIEKAYNTFSWSVILVTLAKMNFPSNWISWIKTCLTSTSFSFLINGHPTRWISSSKGLRQGDPIFSYLFILVSQILTSMLNSSLNIGQIMGFNNNANSNFNHLIYDDDLVLIIRASRLAERNINHCLDIYGQLISQYLNVSKSTVYFPSWFNKRA